MNTGLFHHRRALDVQSVLLLHHPAPVAAGGCTLLRLLAALALAFTALVPALWLMARLLLAPMPGEWAMPLRLGPLHAEVGVPSVLRLATAPAFGAWLDGVRMDTRWGPVTLGWQADTHSLRLVCTPCRLPVAALGEQPLQLEQLTLMLRRNFNTLEGSLQASTGRPGTPAIEASFTGSLRQQDLALHFSAPATPVAHWYAVLAPGLPELRQAHIQGTLALQARLDLPSGRFDFTPTLSGFEVHGLGTEVFANAASVCGKPSRVRNNDWLARSVIAAEDQRFYEHPGYDLQELAASLATNQERAAVARGASTITQQLAKRLVAGDERSTQRKLRELLYAVEMEHTLGKARILQLYLDNAPWGAPGLCGAEAAARRYFQRSARSLAPAQAVWLAAMLHQPEREASLWAQQGRINLVRAQWVAGGVRGIHGVGPRERKELQSRLLELELPTPATTGVGANRRDTLR